MKYRIYRKLSQIEYKDIEAKNEEDAMQSRYDGLKDWKCISSGIISDAIVTEDLSKENSQIFIERDIANL